MNYLEFEKPLAEIEGKAEELRALARDNSEMDIEKEAAALDKKAKTMLVDLYNDLSPWRKCQVARHADRPHTKDYIETLFTEYTPLAGDRNFADDHAVMGGLARFNDQPVMVIGHEKGNDTKSRIERNFGMARPEGYRKAIRLMDMAHRFNLPVITLVDTPVTRSHHATPPLCSHTHFCHQLFRPGRSPWRPHVTPQTIGTIVVAFTRPSMASPSLSRPLRDHDSHGLSRASGRRQVAIPSHGDPLGAASVVWRAPAHAPHRLQ